MHRAAFLMVLLLAVSLAPPASAHPPTPRPAAPATDPAGDQPSSSIGASAGDVLGDLSVTAGDRDGGPTGGGPLPDNVPADDSSASDRAPDAGAAAAFTLRPPPFQSDLAAEVVGGEIREAN